MIILNDHNWLFFIFFLLSKNILVFHDRRLFFPLSTEWNMAEYIGEFLVYIYAHTKTCVCVSIVTGMKKKWEFLPNCCQYFLLLVFILLLIFFYSQKFVSPHRFFLLYLFFCHFRLEKFSYSLFATMASYINMIICSHRFQFLQYNEYFLIWFFFENTF